MKEIIEALYPLNRTLLGEGYDSALMYLQHLLPFEIIEIPSGTKFGTWTVPDEWIVKDAYIKFKGEKIVDYKTNPLCLTVGSTKTKTSMDERVLKDHLKYSADLPESTAYDFKYYGLKPEHDWSMCVPKSVRDNLEPGMYEIVVDTEYKPGKMKLAVHTIKGESDREILLFAHLDHPYQANDNLSAVACLMDLAKKIKAKHTIKIIFCPETIGSIAYAHTQDLSKVDFVIAVDICGNDNSLLIQKSYNAEDRLNRVAHSAVQSGGESYRKGMFRNTIGSDEYVFNDPKIGIPGLMISRWPYPEYHTAEDTPDKINYEMIEKTGKAILKIIDIYEKDFIPKREFTGPLMRSKYDIQSPSKQFNLSWDYFIYAMDGVRSLAELCCDYGLNFDFTLEVINKMIDDKIVSRIDISEGRVKKTPTKKQKGLSRKANVPRKYPEVPQAI